MTRTDTPDTDTVESEYPELPASPWADNGGPRAGAGAKPLPPELKMRPYKVSLPRADMEFLDLFIDKGVDPAQRTPGHLVRAGIARLRLHCPNGPDRSFYTPEPGMPQKARTTPAVAREATKLGITRAEMINRLWEDYSRRKEGEK